MSEWDVFSATANEWARRTMRERDRADRLHAVCETLHMLLDEGCTLRAETTHEGKTILALLYDAMHGDTTATPTGDQGDQRSDTDRAPKG